MSYEFTLYIKASCNLCSVIAGHIILCNYFSISTSGNSVFMVGFTKKNGKPCSLKVALIFCCVKPVGESIIKIRLALGSHLMCPYPIYKSYMCVRPSVCHDKQRRAGQGQGWAGRGRAGQGGQLKVSKKN